MAIAVRTTADVTAPAYMDLLAADAGNLFYASPGFLRFIADVTASDVSLMVAERDGQMVGALPFAVKRSDRFGTVVNSLPWWGSHGAVLTRRAASDADLIRRELLRAFRSEVRRLDALFATMIGSPAEFSATGTYEQELHPRAVDTRIGQFTRLPATADLEPLLSVFRQKTRNLVRKSLNQGFREYVGTEDWCWEFLFETHRSNMLAIGGRYKPFDHFMKLRKHIPADLTRLSICMHGDTPVGAMLTFSFNGTVEYFTPAIVVEHRSKQPLSFLIVHAMLAAIRRGDRDWNWGGTWTTQTQLHHFKAGFGAEDVEYRYYVSASDVGLSHLAAQKTALAEEFPYFYIYPYGSLT